MVLSNKKLKQKLRANLADSLASTEQNPNPNPPQSLKQLLDSTTQRPRLSKRVKRRENQSSRGSEANENGSETMKRKRKKSDEEDGVLKSEDTHESDQKKKKNPKKKKKMKKKKSKNVEEKQSDETENGEKMAMETTEKNENSQASGYARTKVYVGGIPYYSTEDDIRSYFEGCGTVTEVDCMTFPESGKFRGIAIISFKTEAAANRALALDGSDMGGLFLTIQPFKANRTSKTSDFAPQAVEGYNRIYVGNLSWDITEDKLRNFFSDCKISSVRFGMDKDSGEFRGYAHVDFSDSLSKTMALKLDQKVVCGRPAKISCAVPLRKEPASKARSDQSSVITTAMKTTPPPPLATVVTAPKETVATITEIINPNSTENGNTDVGLSSVSTGKMRRRTCYECGEKGHISSDCPKKTVSTAAPPPIGPAVTAPAMITEIVIPTSLPSSTETGNASTGLSSVSIGKMKRRTCYECGEKGHISSDCPKRTVGSTNANV